MAYTTIDDSSAHFQTVLYTGTGSSRSVTNDGNSDLQPDWLWFKKRNNSKSHVLNDTTRGITKSIYSNENSGEGTESAGLSSVNSDGFTVGSEDRYNGSSETYVCWQWKCNGGTTSTNGDGGVNVTIQENSTAGFNIMKWNGDGTTTSTVGHGLGATPDMILNKYGLDGSSNWGVAFPKFETSKLLTLNGTNAFATASGLSGYNSSTFVDGNGAATGGTIAYAFKNIQGYSKMGKYIGNGNSDGPFIYTGFKPAFILGKNATSAGNHWFMNDSKRGGNGGANWIKADSSAAELTNLTNPDFYSNGFKIRNDNAIYNENNSEFYYMAFAVHPFTSSKGVPVTAG